VGAGGDALSPAGPARDTASHGWSPTWPEALMAAALALCLALRRYGRAERTGRRLRRAQHGLRARGYSPSRDTTAGDGVLTDAVPARSSARVTCHGDVGRRW